MSEGNNYVDYDPKEIRSSSTICVLDDSAQDEDKWIISPSQLLNFVCIIWLV